MRLTDVLSQDQILLDLQAKDRTAAIREMLDQLDQKGLLRDEDPALLEQLLNERELQYSTGIGSGLAIPHASSETTQRVIAIFARSKEGVDFESVDGTPVNFIILFVSPKKDYHLHIRTLAAIAKTFTSPDIRKGLAEAETKKEVLSILNSRPSRVSREC